MQSAVKYPFPDYVLSLLKYYGLNPATQILKITTNAGPTELFLRSKSGLGTAIDLNSFDEISEINVPYLLYPLLYARVINETDKVNFLTKMLDLSQSMGNSKNSKGKLLNKVVIESRYKTSQPGIVYPPCHGFNAIAVACSFGSKKLVNALIDLGADVNCITRFKHGSNTIWATPYHFVSVKAGAEFLEWMVHEKGLKVPNSKLSESGLGLEFSCILTGDGLFEIVYGNQNMMQQLQRLQEGSASHVSDGSIIEDDYKQGYYSL